MSKKTTKSDKVLKNTDSFEKIKLEKYLELTGQEQYFELIGRDKSLESLKKYFEVNKHSSPLNNLLLYLKALESLYTK